MLTQKEIDVLKLKARGLTQLEIAKKLNITQPAVSSFYNNARKKIREAELQKIPYILVIGEKEQKAKSVAVRQRGKGDIGLIKLEKFIEKITKEIKEKKS